jgi:hypothetical protein
MLIPTPKAYHEQALELAKKPSYRQSVEELRDVLSPIRGRIIAIDIEGTLASKTLPEHYRGWWRKKLTQRVVPMEHFWLLRPLSQEIIDILVERNKVILWTVANVRTARLIFKITGLKIPRKVPLVAKEHNQKLLQKHNMYNKPVRLRDGGKFRLNEKVKIPSLLKVEALLDDQVVNCHGPFVERIRPRDLEKLIQVELFCPETFAAVRRGWNDRGLLKAARDLSTLLGP